MARDQLKVVVEGNLLKLVESGPAPDEKTLLSTHNGVVPDDMQVVGGQTAAAVDRQDRRVLLFPSEWERQYFERQHPAIALMAESPITAPNKS